MLLPSSLAKGPFTLGIAGGRGELSILADVNLSRFNDLFYNVHLSRAMANGIHHLRNNRIADRRSQVCNA